MRVRLTVCLVQSGGQRFPIMPLGVMTVIAAELDQIKQRLLHNLTETGVLRYPDAYIEHDELVEAPAVMTIPAMVPTPRNEPVFALS